MLQFVIIAVALIGVFGSSACSAFRKELVLSRDDLQAQIEGRFPLEKKKRLIKLRLSEPELLLRPDHARIGMRLAIEAKLPGVRPLSGVLEADGELVYSPELGRFASAEGRLLDLGVQGLGGKKQKMLEEIVAAVVAYQLSSITVYELDQADFKESLAKLVLKSVEVHGDVVVVEVGL